MSDQIICPKCGTQVTITDAIANQLKHDLEIKHQQQIAFLKKEQLEKEKKLQIQLEAKEQEIKKEMWDKAKAAAEKNQEVQSQKQAIEMEDLRQQLSEQKKRNDEFAQQELELRKQKRELEARQKEIELEINRKLDDEKAKIFKQADEEHRLKDLEKDKQLSDLNKQIEELKRKAQQGSQQNQGEVLELDLEKKLCENFVTDQINPVGKGVHGADIVQTVCSRNGSQCGVILWEIKQTKNWTEAWIGKLKDDLRANKANIPVIVSTVLPKEVTGFGYYNKVWVVLPNLALQLAGALRHSMIAIAFERSATQGKGEKAELLFNYVASHEFRQRVEALVEVFQDMQGQILRERVAFEKSWKQREMQLHRLFVNTAGMYGEMQGLVGSTMPEIKGLEINEQEKLNEKNEEKLF